MSIVLLVAVTLVVFTWPLWLLPAVSSLRKMVMGKKRTGTAIVIAKDIDKEANRNREPVAKETYTWETRRVTRERVIYRQGE